MAELNIASLNLCLGIKNKKLDVERLLEDNVLDILCVQETEVESNFDVHCLDLKNFLFELEINSVKSRSGIYISQLINYKRRSDLEGIDSHITIIDITSPSSIKRIINIYRSFNPQGGVNARQKFIYQLEVIKNAMIEKCLLLGDFNLDYNKIYDVNYSQQNMFDDFDDNLAMFNLVQIVNFPTWSRLVGQTLRSSIIDHIYVRDPTLVFNLSFVQPTFGDHVMIKFSINGKRTAPIPVERRDWRRYSSGLLIDRLNGVDWNIGIDDVQNFWNEFESKLVRIIDEIAPMATFHGNVIKEKAPKAIKNKINKRNRLLKSFRENPSSDLKKSIKQLNCEIKMHYFGAKKMAVRKGILPGNSKSLWQAVKVAKNQGQPFIPQNMQLNNLPVSSHEISEEFASFFESKVNGIVSNTAINHEVHNGYRKMTADSKMFMTRSNVLDCVSKIKLKNTEGYDRIPQRILVEGRDALIVPLTELFRLIYRDKLFLVSG